MGYASWINLHLINGLEGPLAVQNSQLLHGKFYADDDKDEEITPDQVDEIVIPESGSGDVYSCGRQGAPAGTQGSFDLIDKDTQKICTITWSSPFGGGGNYISASDVDRHYRVGVPAVSANGPIGFADITVEEL
ncbi:hypothetical protein ACJ73_02251 [Blastomyces percursus]|uniref:Asp-hemolysin n=1 Tax=Blastomyces percursus TaxID=1658174 RepID=A0A1J9QBY5_9EURO|nr:hypothetical protein ACJ73_02251 [Blastomyces percursus]